MSQSQILSDEQRCKLLESLIGAPDEVLLGAVQEMRRHRIDIQNDFKEVSGFIGMKTIETAPPLLKPTTEVVTQKPQAAANEVIETKNKRPPGTAPTKIGGETKEKILARCLQPATVEDVNKFLGRGMGKLEETKGLLRLLWDRGEISHNEGVYRRVS